MTRKPTARDRARRVALAVLPAAALLAAVGGVQPAGAAFSARGSAEQVHVTGAAPGARLVLRDRRGRRVAVRLAGALGAAVFRHVAPGRGYRVRRPAGRSRRLTVFSTRSAPPSTALYDQAIPARGYGYLTTRDGTKLAINVQLPAGEGPYPTLVEYSGYGYADPAGGQSSITS